MRRFLAFLLMLVLTVMALAVGFQNTALVTVDYLVGQQQMPLSTLMSLMILVGLIIGLIPYWLTLLTGRFRNR